MRPSLLGNPYTIGIDGTRADVIEQFELRVRSERSLMEYIAELDDVDLVCCCSPMPCHGDVILKLWDELNP
jgi:predicted dehydrogenase